MYREENDALDYGSSGNPLVKSKGLPTLLLTARVEEGFRETTRGLPEASLYPLTSRGGCGPKTLRMRFLSVHRV